LRLPQLRNRFCEVRILYGGDNQLRRNIMRMFITGAVGGLALVTASVAGASTPQNSQSMATVEQHTTTQKLAQNQDTRQRGQEYNKDTTKRKSWGGG
jgi:hypothetical protein